MTFLSSFVGDTSNNLRFLFAPYVDAWISCKVGALNTEVK